MGSGTEPPPPIERVLVPSSGPAETVGQGYGELLASSLLLLALVIGGLVAVVVAARAFGRRGRGAGRGGWMEVLARLPLEPRRSLYVVRVAERTLVLGSSEQGLTLLRELEGGELPAAAEPVTGPSFPELVARASAALRSKRGPAAGPAVVAGPAGPTAVEERAG